MLIGPKKLSLSQRTPTTRGRILGEGREAQEGGSVCNDETQLLPGAGSQEAEGEDSWAGAGGGAWPRGGWGALGRAAGTPLEARSGGWSAWHSGEKLGLPEQVRELELEAPGCGAGESVVPSDQHHQHRGLSVSVRSHGRPPALPPSHLAPGVARMVNESCRMPLEDDAVVSCLPRLHLICIAKQSACLGNRINTESNLRESQLFRNLGVI